jgi:hypothetical protein
MAKSKNCKDAAPAAMKSAVTHSRSSAAAKPRMAARRASEKKPAGMAIESEMCEEDVITYFAQPKANPNPAMHVLSL